MTAVVVGFAVFRSVGRVVTAVVVGFAVFRSVGRVVTAVVVGFAVFRSVALLGGTAFTVVTRGVSRLGALTCWATDTAISRDDRSCKQRIVEKYCNFVESTHGLIVIPNG